MGLGGQLKKVVKIRLILLAGEGALRLVAHLRVEDSVRSIGALLGQLKNWLTIIKSFEVLLSVLEHLLLVNDALYFLVFHLPNCHKVKFVHETFAPISSVKRHVPFFGQVTVLYHVHASLCIVNELQVSL